MVLFKNNHKYFIFILLLIIIIFKDIIYYLINNVYNNSININLTNKNENKKLKIKETMTNFNNSFVNSLGEIFKNSHYNFGEYKNVEFKPSELFFKNNKFLPECCNYYSDYSTSRGCPCITPEQQYYLKRRGLNRSLDSTSNIVYDKNEDKKDFKNIFFSPSKALKGEQFPFNPVVNKEYNVYNNGDQPPLSDISNNNFKKLINKNSFFIKQPLIPV
jgi:hypothetical protein